MERKQLFREKWWYSDDEVIINWMKCTSTASCSKKVSKVVTCQNTRRRESNSAVRTIRLFGGKCWLRRNQRESCKSCNILLGVCAFPASFTQRLLLQMGFLVWLICWIIMELFQTKFKLNGTSMVVGKYIPMDKQARVHLQVCLANVHSLFEMATKLISIFCWNRISKMQIA